MFALSNIMCLSWIAIGQFSKEMKSNNSTFCYAGVDRTGLFANPINASAQTFWCTNSNVVNHLLVYWVSPILAIWVVYGLKDSTLFSQFKRKAD